MKNPNEVECSPEDIALKSMFLGPQAENATWVIEWIIKALNRWYHWRRKCYPDDGTAISFHDQQLSAFRSQQNTFERVLNTVMDRFEEEVPKFSPRYMGHMFSEFSLPALFGHIITLMHNPNNVSKESSRVGVELEAEAIDDLLTMVGLDPTKGSGHFTSGGTVANFEAMYRAIQRGAIWTSSAIVDKLNQHPNLFTQGSCGWENFDSLFMKHQQNTDLFNAWNFCAIGMTEFANKFAVHFRKEFPSPVLMIPQHAHYSWEKAASLMGLGRTAIWPIAVDQNGRQLVSSLRDNLKKAQAENRLVLLVVSVLGTTELGSCDPIAEICEELEAWETNHGVSIWHHIDAAYGGFFCSLRGSAQIATHLSKAMMAVSRCDSVTIDPHKLGYVPYSSGVFLAKERRNYQLKSSDPPYIQFEKQDRGRITLEGSRSAAGAVATWMTSKIIGLKSDEFGRIVLRTLQLKEKISIQMIHSIPGVRIAPGLDTNVLCFIIAHTEEPLSIVNQRTLRIFQGLSHGNDIFFVSKTAFDDHRYGLFNAVFVDSWKGLRDCSEVLFVRMCLMNPFLESKEMKNSMLADFCNKIISLSTTGVTQP